MTISKDTSAPLVAIIGATGQQGGSVIKALAASNKPYRVRGATRDTSKGAAKALTNQGVEMVSVNIHPDNKDQIVKFFEGATYGFGVTNFWEHSSKDQETLDGKVMVDAAKKAGVKRFVWSGLSNCSKHSNGKYTKVDHFDGKAHVTDYGHSVKTGEFEFVSVEAGMYMSNFMSYNPPVKGEDGSLAIYLPIPAGCKIPFINVQEDYGLFVQKAIEEPNPSKDIFAYGELTSMQCSTEELSEVIGKKVAYKEISKDQYIQGATATGVPETVAVEMYEMMQYINEFGYYGTNDIQSSREGLAGETRSFKDYAKTIDWNKVLNK